MHLSILKTTAEHRRILRVVTGKGKQTTLEAFKDALDKESSR